MKIFVLIVTFAATTDLIGGARAERIASFDDYQACASAGRTLYSQQHWECVPENQPQGSLAAGKGFSSTAGALRGLTHRDA